MERCRYLPALNGFLRDDKNAARAFFAQGHPSYFRVSMCRFGLSVTRFT
jgi:hypothetical protein